MKEDHFNFQSKLKVAASSIVSVSKFKRGWICRQREGRQRIY